MPIDWKDCSADAFDSTGKFIGKTATLSCIPLILSSIVYWALLFAGIIAIFIIVFAGFKYINSGGDPKQADTARKTLIYAIFGLLLIFMSFFIIKTVGYFTNVSCINTFGFNNCDTGATPNTGDNPAPPSCNRAIGDSCTDPSQCCRGSCQPVDKTSLDSPKECL